MRCDGREVGRVLREDAPLELDDVVLGQEVRGVRDDAPEAGLVHALADVLLDLVDRVLQALGDGVAAEGLHVEAVGLGGEDQERHHSLVGSKGKWT